MLKKLALILGLVSAAVIGSAQVGVDGVIGAEWTGANVVSVGYDANAPLGNFGTPGTTNHLVGYNIYTRSDANYTYGAVVMTPLGAGQDQLDQSVAQFFTNIYVSTTMAGSNVGFELLNDRAFIPGQAGYYSTLSSAGVTWGTTAPTSYANGGTPGVIEFAVPWTFYATDPLNIGFTQTNNQVRWNLSQTFGYSVAGGQANFGSNRLGVWTNPVPEPTTMAAMGIGLFAAIRRRRAARN